MISAIPCVAARGQAAAVSPEAAEKNESQAGVSQGRRTCVAPMTSAPRWSPLTFIAMVLEMWQLSHVVALRG